jgi:hypothetical protein
VSIGVGLPLPVEFWCFAACWWGALGGCLGATSLGIGEVFSLCHVYLPDFAALFCRLRGKSLMWFKHSTKNTR